MCRFVNRALERLESKENMNGEHVMNMFFTTERLCLKILSAHGVGEVFQFYEENREHIEPWEGEKEENFYTLSYQQALMEAEYNQIIRGVMFRVYIFLKDVPGQVIGSVSVSHIRRGVFQTGTIGYKIHKTYCNHGIGAEAVGKVLEIMFEEWGLHRIEAMVHPENGPSISLLKKLGFQQEGKLSKAAKLFGGWEDMYLFAVVNNRRECRYKDE